MARPMTESAEELELQLDTMQGMQRRAISMSLARVLEIEFAGWQLERGDAAGEKYTSPVQNRAVPPKGWALEKMVFNRRGDAYGHRYSPTASEASGDAEGEGEASARVDRSRSTSPLPQPFPAWATPSPRVGRGRRGAPGAHLAADITHLTARLATLEKRVESLSPARDGDRASPPRQEESKVNLTLSPSEPATGGRGGREVDMSYNISALSDATGGYEAAAAMRGGVGSAGATQMQQPPMQKHAPQRPQVRDTLFADEPQDASPTRRRIVTGDLDDLLDVTVAPPRDEVSEKSNVTQTQADDALTSLSAQVDEERLCALRDLQGPSDGAPGAPCPEEACPAASVPSVGTPASNASSAPCPQGPPVPVVAVSTAYSTPGSNPAVRPAQEVMSPSKGSACSTVSAPSSRGGGVDVPSVFVDSAPATDATLVVIDKGVVTVNTAASSPRAASQMSSPRGAPASAPVVVVNVTSSHPSAAAPTPAPAPVPMSPSASGGGSMLDTPSPAPAAPPEVMSDPAPSRHTAQGTIDDVVSKPTATATATATDLTTSCSSIQYEQIGSATSDAATSIRAPDGGDSDSEVSSCDVEFPGNPLNVIAQNHPVSRPLWLPAAEDDAFSSSTSSPSSRACPSEPDADISVDGTGSDVAACAVGTVVEVSAGRNGPWMRGRIDSHRMGVVWVLPEGWATPASFKHLRRMGE
eukprot:TRINITY_DN4011_c0_g2_i1.p1 TRINITY_DN4011_c0_g2~~TRINITY_DN4011_c0_g2_i1.p1  ORF type:complete len:726 (+),score=131.33 TRINITY_DN4011_c0_g2_i1:89-2179(+)